jgi:hypothetical protein
MSSALASGQKILYLPSLPLTINKIYQTIDVGFYPIITP